MTQPPGSPGPPTLGPPIHAATGGIIRVPRVGPKSHTGNVRTSGLWGGHYVWIAVRGVRFRAVVAVGAEVRKVRVPAAPLGRFLPGSSLLRVQIVHCCAISESAAVDLIDGPTGWRGLGLVTELVQDNTVPEWLLQRDAYCLEVTDA